MPNQFPLSPLLDEKRSESKAMVENVGEPIARGMRADIQKVKDDIEAIYPPNIAEECIEHLNAFLAKECGISKEVLSDIPSEAFARTNIMSPDELRTAIQKSEDTVSVCRCKDCQRWIPIDKIKDDEEYGYIDTEPGIILGYDGFCTNTDKWANSDEYCSSALSKED